MDAAIQRGKARTKESKATMNSNAKTDVATLPSSPKAQAAKEVIDANVKLLIEQLEAGHSEGLTAYLTAMGRFHSNHIKRRPNPRDRADLNGHMIPGSFTIVSVF